MNRHDYDYKQQVSSEVLFQYLLLTIFTIISSKMSKFLGNFCPSSA